jgi:hypothetical protein
MGWKSEFMAYINRPVLPGKCFAIVERYYIAHSGHAFLDTSKRFLIKCFFLVHKQNIYKHRKRIRRFREASASHCFFFALQMQHFLYMVYSMVTGLSRR